jgi:hypothetical protein
VTEPQRKPESAEPTPELPQEGADLEPQGQPLTHHEPVATHGHDHEPALGDIPAEEHAVAHGAAAHAGAPGDSHAGGHGADHHEERLGPVDWAAWGYVVVGVAVALAVVAAFWVAAYG